MSESGKAALAAAMFLAIVTLIAVVVERCEGRSTDLRRACLEAGNEPHECARMR